ncbi:MAG: MFS transporter, partial [Myxococcaceae bacterium]
MSVDAAARLHRPYRWAVLLAFVLAVGVTQMLWLNFAPLLALVQTRYGVSELLASTLILVFPLLYVFFSLPAGAMTDRRGYRFTVGLGAIATAAFSALRIWDSSFWMIMAGQLGIAVAQPFVVNGISKLVADWFDEEQGAIATGLGTMGMFLGMALGMATTPALEQAVGLRWTMVIFFGISAAAAAFFVGVARANPGGAPAAPATGSQTAGFGALLRSRHLLLFFGIAFLGLGTFNGLTTW